MKYKCYFLLFALLGFAISGFAQKKQRDSVRKYLDNHLSFTNKTNMDFAAMAVRERDHWLVVSVYPDTNILLRAYFLDEKLTIKDGPFTLYHPHKIKAVEAYFINNIKQGAFRSWYTNGQIKDSGFYVNNYQSGEWYTWNEEGQLTAILHYQDSSNIKTVARALVNPNLKRPSMLAGDTSIGVLSGTALRYFPTGQLQDSGAYKFNHKQGIWKYWYANGQMESTGAYVNGQQEGEWEFFRESGIRSTKEKYVKNKVAALECYDEQGAFSGNTCPLQKPPVALGKFMDFDKYVLDNIYWPQELAYADIQGKVIIEYTITKEGELVDLKVLDTPHKLMAMAVMKFFNALKWSPAVSHNRPIAQTMRYAVPFFR
ncbi:hypothetical protein D3H65_18040 [Paraflavitalea soli]|uniref:TonB C-terminal domain-containing protein n=1 Tax=Paraflavitalea soli TaxID=2315862 RepID=A0A3B7MS14_9BACT|nr:energy transducer TonB [Paraflavitalea soli]AXY75766.1 hypothetical protein D3H65_18040 [Paraflavitalea soli]